MTNYQWQAVSSNKTGKRVSTNWHNTAREAKEAFFKDYPTKRACNISSGKQDPKIPGLMLWVWNMPYIRDCRKQTQLDC